jgi:hypothetical protein
VCGTLDASQILQKRVRLINCYAADTNCDGNGPEAKSRYYQKVGTGETPRFLTIGDPLLNEAGTEINVPIMIDNAADMIGYYVALSFDTTQLQYMAVTAGTVTAEWGEEPVVNAQEGRLYIASAGIDAATGAGELLWVTFALVSPGAIPASVPAQFLEAELNDGEIPVDYESPDNTEGEGEGESEGEPPAQPTGCNKGSITSGGSGMKGALPFDSLLLALSCAILLYQRRSRRRTC